MNGLLVSVITGAIGVGYLMYGRRLKKLNFTLAGILLCVYPYFTDNLVLLLLVGAGLLATPFFLDF